MDFSVVRGCVPQNISASQCGANETNLMITVVQQSYEYSPFIHKFISKIVNPDIANFSWSFGAVFIILFFILALGINLIIQILITHPIRDLSMLIRKNDFRSDQLRKNYKKGSASDSKSSELSGPTIMSRYQNSIVTRFTSQS